MAESKETIEQTSDHVPSPFATTVDTTATRAHYGSSEYWNTRYTSSASSTTSKPFEWYCDYVTLAPIIRQYQPANDSVRTLHLGVGTSAVPQAMIGDGYRHHIATDISDTLIETLAAAAAGTDSGIDYQCMSATDLQLDDSSFDIVIDKGTIDALTCNDSDNDSGDCARLVSEANRVLTSGGIFVLVSHSSKAHRLPLLQCSCYHWTIHCYRVRFSPQALLIREVKRLRKCGPSQSQSAVLVKAMKGVQSIIANWKARHGEAMVEYIDDSDSDCEIDAANVGNLNYAFCYVCIKS